MTTISPINAARARLQVALLAGKDTTTHRIAINRLRANAKSSADRHVAESQVNEAQRVTAIEQRAATVAANVQGRVDALLRQHSIPNLERGRNE